MKRWEEHPLEEFHYWDDCEILRFDWMDRVWVRMESMEGGALFLRQGKSALEFLRERTQK